jgi:hypothetical protein
MAPTLNPASAPLARQARERFVAHLEGVLPGLLNAVRSALEEQMNTAQSSRDMQQKRDALVEYERAGPLWLDGAAQAWRRALVPASATSRVRMQLSSLELIGDDVVENKILSSRLAMAVQEKAVWDLNDLKLRIAHLEDGEELASDDVLRPEALAQLLVEQWSAAQLTRETWTLVKDVIQQFIVPRALEGYQQANEFLIANGVLPNIDLRSRVKRPTTPERPVRPAPTVGGSGEGGTGGGVSGGQGGRGGGGAGGGGSGTGTGSGFGSGSGGSGFGSGGQGSGSGFGAGGGGSGRGGPSGFGSSSGHAGPGGGGGGGGSGGGGGGGGGQAGGAGQGGFAGEGGSASQAGGAGGYGGQGGQGGGPEGQSAYGGPGGGADGQWGAQGRASSFAGSMQSGFSPGNGDGNGNGAGGAGSGLALAADGGGQGQGQGQGGGQGGRQGGGIADETRMMTNTTPLARARARATGVIGQLRRLLRDKVAGFDPADGGKEPPSASLVEAVSLHASQVHTQVQSRVNEAMTLGDIVVFDDDDVEQVALDLRSRSQELKRMASSSSEKATIEIVALMFQSILSEERIPSAVRVWFARLQMPVLRVALAEPEFFGSLEHPARQLIDRLGSCVLGFDTAAISGSALETEIRRVVQVIEQYPETGRRVFQLVYEEFQRFLSRFLTEKGPTQKLVSIAQQVEQKETMAIQYTIELRKMLSDVPVREEIREYLFKVWAEVLAVAAVKNGPQHEETLALKKSASDLVWAASAKPNRNDRAKVIQDLPDLLARLRRGMTLLGLAAGEQENHIKVIGDTLADAFLSKTEAIPHARIEEMTRRLANLEDFVSDDDAGELPLDRESIEMMLGIDASMIEVISAGGSQPSDGMMSWANELQLGNWFTLDHNGRVAQVQYAWASDRRQLHLFAAQDGYCYLMPLRRLGAYLQAGLLVPNEEETLTVRATRDALAKLDANPERLLQ